MAEKVEVPVIDLLENKEKQNKPHEDVIEESQNRSDLNIEDYDFDNDLGSCRRAGSRCISSAEISPHFDSRENCKPFVKAPITTNYVPGRKDVIVKPSTPSQVNLNGSCRRAGSRCISSADISPHFDSRENCKPFVEAPITTNYVPGRKDVIVKPSTPSQVILNGDKIPVEEVVCRFCFETCIGRNGFQMTCRCGKDTFAHESCTNPLNNICNGCGQDLQKVSVSFHLESTSVPAKPQEAKKGGFASKLRRYFNCWRYE